MRANLLRLPKRMIWNMYGSTVKKMNDGADLRNFRLGSNVSSSSLFPSPACKPFFPFFSLFLFFERSGFSTSIRISIFFLLCSAVKNAIPICPNPICTCVVTNSRWRIIPCSISLSDTNESTMSLAAMSSSMGNMYRSALDRGGGTWEVRLARKVGVDRRRHRRRQMGRDRRRMVDRPIQNANDGGVGVGEDFVPFFLSLSVPLSSFLLESNNLANRPISTGKTWLQSSTAHIKSYPIPPYAMMPNIVDAHSLNANSTPSFPNTDDECPSGFRVREPLTITNRQKNMERAAM
mmetsp:Transcript_39615/g.95284  ORF Transcript_39615/g.95284 Transcript_39615/m.95284 type:complete len:292 (-) Transcript_39615:233-1108(-)